MTGRYHVALLTLPQKEAAACAVLRNRYGVEGVYPVETVLNRLRTRRAGQPIHYERRLLPGYVFAAFPELPPLHELLATRYIRDAIRTQSGDLAILHPDDLRRIYAMRQRAEAARNAMQAAAVIKPGDVALLGGVFDAAPVDVLIVGQGQARVRLRLYEREITVPLTQLVKAAE